MRQLSALGPAAIGVALLIPLVAASLATGAAQVDLLGGDARSALILGVSRLPRTLAVLLAGAALAVAGVVVQQLVRNRFVEPGTTGTTEAASAGLLAMVLLAPAAPIWLSMAAASVAALAGTALFLLMIRRIPRHEPMLVPLAGLVYSGVLQAGVTFVAIETDLRQFIGTWIGSGEFSGVIAGRYEFLWVGGVAALLAWFAADRFAILGMGDTVATGLGLNPAAVMRLGLAVVAVVSAMVVATVGSVPFVGLVVPNIVARLAGDNLRSSLPLVALGGAGLLLACDLVGRLVIAPYEIPAGAVMGVFGAAVFLWLLHRRPRGA